MKKKVSIIIPTYNGINTIHKSLHSVFSQTYRNYEVIIVDDGSTDATIDFIKANFPSVTVIQQKNQGTMTARQSGINASEGSLIALLDQDDIWFDNHLETAVNFLNAHLEYGLYIANMAAIDENGNELNFNVVPEPEKYFLTFENLLLIQPIATSTIVCRKKIIDQIGGLNTMYGFSGAIGDLDFLVRASEVTQLHFENKNLGLYRWAETRPGRLISFADNLRIYAETFWQHPRLASETNLELREKFVRACCDYSIVIWRLLLQQVDNKISLSLLEKLNEHNKYMQSVFADYYDRIIGLQSIQIRVFQTEREVIRTLLFLYLMRKELQEFYPGVLRGELRELLSWASDVAHKQQEDIDSLTLEKYAGELIYLERDGLKDELARTKLETVSIAQHRAAMDGLKDELARTKLETVSIAQHRAAMDGLKDELARTKLELEIVYHSRSWRITEPIRKFTALQRSLRQKLSRLASVRMLPRQVILKSIRMMTLWVAAHPKLYQMGIRLLNRFPGIKKRLITQIYRDHQETAYFSVYEQPLPMSPPVKKIHMDLLAAIQKQKQNTSGE